MKKTFKRAVSLLLTLTLMFSAVMMFPSRMSAASSASRTVGSYLFSGSVSISSNKLSAIARTNFGTMAGVTAKVTFYYLYGANKTLVGNPSSTNSNTMSAVSTVSRDSAHTLNYEADFALGYHVLSYNGTQYLNTRIDA